MFDEVGAGDGLGFGVAHPTGWGEPSVWDPAPYRAPVERLRALGPSRVHFAYDEVAWERGP